MLDFCSGIAFPSDLEFLNIYISGGEYFRYRWLAETQASQGEYYDQNTLSSYKKVLKRFGEELGMLDKLQSY